ncbi:SCO4848 family membrane protein [Streptomyces sp. NPDC015492]|uniref:SCO4848 family membrane protein n=1 Tax=Streptomyces sp. NPDC015492 TaxID=3364958 RepID=UPI0036F5A03A
MPSAVVAGVCTLTVSCVWIIFVKNLWNAGSGLAFDDAGDPTAYFWVHLLLAVTSFVLGTVIGVLGLRGVRGARREVG